MFKRRWGQWTDISTGNYFESKYVLQARRHRNGRIQMRVEEIKAFGSVHPPTIDQLKGVK